MSRTLTINGTNYIFPEQGTDPAWGEVVVDWAEAVTGQINSIVSEDEILTKSFVIVNNTTSASDVTGLVFDFTSVRAAIVSYTIIRTTSTVTSGKAELGYINILYDGGASAGSQAIVQQDQLAGDAGVTFTCTDTGQVQYTSTNLAGLGYSGVMKFSATTKPI
jgi:hypothetical protein